MCVSYQHDARLYRRLYLLQSDGERGGGEQTALGDEFKFVIPKLESPFDGEILLRKNAIAFRICMLLFIFQINVSLNTTEIIRQRY